MVDAADRVTLVDYADDSLDTTYTYGTDPMSPLALGRLVSIERDGESVDYAYDGLGRTTQDGALTYDHDANGNVTTIGYPGGVSATYGYDFADRQESLSVTTSEGTTDVVTAAAYLPSGPLTALTFGTGATEARHFDARYLPESITLDAAEDRTWTYTTDAVGNVTEIAESCAGDLVLSNETVTTAESHQTCGGLTAGPALTVSSIGNLTLEAGTSVVLTAVFAIVSLLLLSLARG